jgi:hypothetical protein
VTHRVNCIVLFFPLRQPGAFFHHVPVRQSFNEDGSLEGEEGMPIFDTCNVGNAAY